MSKPHVNIISIFDNVVTNMLVTDKNFKKWCNLVNKDEKIELDKKKEIINTINNVFEKNKIPKKCIILDTSISVSRRSHLPTPNHTSLRSHQSQQSQRSSITTPKPERKPVSGRSSRSPIITPKPVSGRSSRSPIITPKPVSGRSSRSPITIPKPVSGRSSRSPITIPKPVSGRSSRSPIITPKPVSGRSSRSPVPMSIPQNFENINEILTYRLKFHDQLENRTDYKIKKLLASIEADATGIVCLSENIKLELDKNDYNTQLAIKIAENKGSDSLKEIYILKNMIPFIKNNHCQNLPIIYNFFQTKKQFILKFLFDKIHNTLYNNISNFLKENRNYNIYTNELAKGDLKSFLNEYDKISSEITEELLNNAIIQIIMSIATLHDIGIRHNDTHYGNFLYHKIKPGGYIKYTISDKSYYLKNLGYLWVIWDFGISTQLNGDTDYFRDYEMLSLYLRKPDNRYNMRFFAKDIKNKKKIETRRAHGNLNLKHKEIPVLINNLADTIYKFSINKELEHVVNETTMNEIISKKGRESLSWFSVQVDGVNINEAIFLNEHINNIFTDVFEHNVSNIKNEEILFHVNINLDQIVFETIGEGTNTKSDYEKTTKKYLNKKIIIPVKYM